MDEAKRLESLVKREEKSDRANVGIRQEWIVEIDLEERGVYISAFQLGFPKQEGEGAEANEHDHFLEGKHGIFFHVEHMYALVIPSSMG